MSRAAQCVVGLQIGASGDTSDQDEGGYQCIVCHYEVAGLQYCTFGYSVGIARSALPARSLVEAETTSVVQRVSAKKSA